AGQRHLEDLVEANACPLFAGPRNTHAPNGSEVDEWGQESYFVLHSSTGIRRLSFTAMPRPSAVLALAVTVAAALTASPTLAQEAARPWIRVAIDKGTKGVVVKQVVEATPAERAGLTVGDEVLAVDGTPVAEPTALIERIQAKGVGEKVTLTAATAAKDRHPPP